MSERKPAGRREEPWQTPAHEGTSPREPEDVRGYTLDDDDIGDEPFPMPVPQPLPIPGTGRITGWPDPTPPVIDPATQAAWAGPKPALPETPEGSP